MKPNLKTHCLAIAVAIVTASTLFAGVAEPQFSDVFIAGKDTFKSIRIPSVVVTKKGTVLAFAEGRAVAADQANNELHPQAQHRRQQDLGRAASDCR